MRIEGTVHDVRVFNTQNGWGFVTVGHTKCVGIVQGISHGDHIVIDGDETTHPKYGKQIKIQSVVSGTPKGEMGIITYLSRNFGFIGPVLARRIYSHFRDQTFDVIEEAPERLTELAGITRERAGQISAHYKEIKHSQQADLFFTTYGITPAYVARMILTYGSKDKAIRAVKENPYELSKSVDGIGFKKADAIALSLGINKNDPNRVKAGIQYTLLDATQEGHCFLPESDLKARANKLLDINPGYVYSSIRDADKDVVVSVGKKIYHPFLLESELGTAEEMSRIIQNADPMPNVDQAMLEEHISGRLDADQGDALMKTLKEGICLITGGPGVGKTWTIQSIVNVMKTEVGHVALAAPTGKAAKRMEEVVGEEAKTIHRLLEYSPDQGGFLRNSDFPLDHRAIVIDESSMIDINLMHALTQAVQSGTRIVFVGDIHQLPSVGPGKVLADLIESGEIPTVYLTKLHRQAANSMININARRINEGRNIIFETDGPDMIPNMEFWDQDEADDIADDICRAVFSLKERFPLDSIQVLCPQKKGKIGTWELNRVLQEIYNPRCRQISQKVPFCIHDKIIQMKNNYTLGVFNGEIGKIVAFNEWELPEPLDKYSEDGHLVIDFFDRQILYPIGFLEEIQLAYALTIHKSQGSEFPAVVIPVHKTNTWMLKRNLIYTGVTRGKQHVILIGQRSALKHAIRTPDTNERNTDLKTYLKGERLNGSGVQVEKGEEGSEGSGDGTTTGDQDCESGGTGHVLRDEDSVQSGEGSPTGSGSIGHEESTSDGT
jgi:exodeoxyribonuclease V alpha subunit